LGGDEFVVLLEQVPDERVAARLLAEAPGAGAGGGLRTGGARAGLG
jgi:hypothetical protein